MAALTTGATRGGATAQGTGSSRSTAGVHFEPRTSSFWLFAAHLIENLLARLRRFGTLDGQRCSTLQYRQRTVLTGGLDFGHHLGACLGTLEVIRVVREAPSVGAGCQIELAWAVRGSAVARMIAFKAARWVSFISWSFPLLSADNRYARSHEDNVRTGTERE